MFFMQFHLKLLVGWLKARKVLRSRDVTAVLDFGRGRNGEGITHLHRMVQQQQREASMWENTPKAKVHKIPDVFENWSVTSRKHKG